MERLVIFGGSFDPIHNGHLRLARAASMILNADILFEPAKLPRWKKPFAGPGERLDMLRLALEEDGSSAFSIDLSEMKRSGDVSYAIDTVKEVIKKFPKREIYWLLGADQVNKFPDWKSAEELSHIARVVYVPRPDIEVDEEITRHFNIEKLNYNGSGPVSSSAIRNLQSLDLPSKVVGYIEDHNLYYMKKVSSFISGHRLAHSLSVAHLASMIAFRNKLLNPGHAYVAGLLHDLGKHLEEEESRKIVAENFPEYADYPAWCLHQFTGAYLAKTEFGILDEDILDAIEFHCTGKMHMPPLTKIIYSADKIDPSRGYDSSKMVEKCLKNYYVGFLAVLKENEKYLEKEGHLEVTPLSESCRELYLGERKKK